MSAKPCPDCGKLADDIPPIKSETLPSGVMTMAWSTRCRACGCDAPKFEFRGAHEPPVLTNDCPRCDCACHVEARKGSASPDSVRLTHHHSSGAGEGASLSVPNGNPDESWSRK